MAITVKYFASLRERLGRAEDELPARTGITAADLWRLATDEDALPPKVLIAVNQEYADLNHPVQDGDEVAFFPPVTGG